MEIYYGPNGELIYDSVQLGGALLAGDALQAIDSASNVLRGVSLGLIATGATALAGALTKKSQKYKKKKNNFWNGGRYLVFFGENYRIILPKPYIKN